MYRGHSFLANPKIQGFDELRIKKSAAINIENIDNNH